MDDDSEIKSEPHNDQGAAQNRLGVAPKSRHPMESLLKSGVGNTFLKAGDIAEGTLLEKKGPRIFIDLGARGLGIVYGREYYAAQDILKAANVGDTVNAKVVDPDNEEGMVELSLKDAGEEKRWLELKKMAQEKTILELPVLEANRGGLILESKGVKGFLPSSQLSSKNYPRVEGGDKEKIFQELQKLVGTILKVRVLDLDAAETKLIFTEKEIGQEAVRQALFKYKIGDVVEGEITGVVDFGAFMKFDEELGLEGLIHISEIDWTLVQDPRSFLKPRDKLKAKIIDVHGEKVSLSLKQLKEDPWKKIADKYRKGDRLHGKVTKFNPFGAFVELDAQIQGLVHISEFGTETRMREELELEKEYDFIVLLIDPKEHRMSLGTVREKSTES